MPTKREKATVEKSAYQKLSVKQRKFLDGLLGHCRGNATRAAAEAGYANAKQEGWRLKRRPDIQTAIEEHFADQALSAGEVRSLIADHARGTIADFIAIADGGWQLNLAQAAERGVLHLVHKISYTKYGPSIELYDAQAAAALYAKLLGLLKEQHEHSGPDGGPIEISTLTDDERRARLAAILERGRDRRDSAVPDGGGEGGTGCAPSAAG